MLQLIQYFKKKYRALSYLLWNKIIIIANLYEHFPEGNKIWNEPSIRGNFVTINATNFRDYQSAFPADFCDLISERLNTFNDICTAYVVEEKIVYWAFITCRSKYYEPAINSYFNVPDDAALIYDTSTLQAFQRKGIHASAFRHVFECVATLRKNRAIMMVLAQNAPALNNLQKFDFKLIQKFIYIPSLGITTSWKML